MHDEVAMSIYMPEVLVFLFKSWILSKMNMYVRYVFVNIIDIWIICSTFQEIAAVRTYFYSCIKPKKSNLC